MNDRVFLDTNIFVYSVDDPNNPKSVITKIARPMSAEQAGRYVSTVFRGLHMIPSSMGLFSDAIGIRVRYRMSWYDSLIVAAAEMAGCGILYSEDLQHGSVMGGVEIRNPFRVPIAPG
jgi:predicted nucleic acid-binding protein